MTRYAIFVLLSLASLAASAEIVVVVNNGNSVDELSQREVIDIYTGRKQSFPDGKPAIPIDQDMNSEIRVSFYRLLVNKSPSEINAYWARLLFSGRSSPPRMMPEAEVIIQAISENPSAIGYIDASMLDDRVKAVARVK